MALRNLTSSQNNVVIGNEARGRAQDINATSGTGNVAVGYKSMNEITSGNNNTAVGQYTFKTGTYSNSTALGSSTAITANNQIRLGNTGVSSIGGQVGWTTVSDARFKKDINENVMGLNFIMKLRPVTYHLDIEKINRYIKSPDVGNKDKEYLKAKAAKEKEVQSGFLAQEVEKAAKELGYEFSGVDKPKNENDHYGLRYGQFVTPLVKGMQEQQKMIEALQKENTLLKKELKAIKELVKNKF